ncbi:UV radiation resistance protein-like protein [Xylogone sp. PMI_703]|nr:UV radiation resistance protein-like protein [Xylogone sp. PMI_703]
MTAEPVRPLLLPQNRRLRHLQGIYIRNITLSRPRGKTIDDAGLNKSPQKLEALREPQLQHSHSSTDLRSRPQGTRRQSTHWAGASPDYRQKKLEDVIDNKMVDTFFSLHIEGQEQPVYISEVAERTINATFRLFDLSDFAPAITRLDSFTIRIWVKRSDYIPLIEEKVNLQALQFIGTLEGHPFPPNCILFHLVDGIYTAKLTSRPLQPRHGPTLPTSSYNALMRLSNLDESIQDALATREELVNQINSLLRDTPIDRAPQAQEEAALASSYTSAERRLLKVSIRRRAELKASILARHEAIIKGREVQSRAQEDVSAAREKLEESKKLLKSTSENIHGQRRRICEELTQIFRIDPTPHTPLLFTICGLPLPNTSFNDNDIDEDVISAALGYVARLVDMLQYYLSVPIPYPVYSFGSRSTIRDPISTLADNQRLFPLYMKGAIRFRFDYAVFLLNKNIEALAESQGLKVIDIRHTLPNLKYVLYVASAGTSELPARKAGGVRGLLSGRGTTPLGSRRGSEDSAIGHGDAARKALEHHTGNGHGLEPQKTPVVALPFAMDQMQSLKTRGMRENVH